MQNKLKKIFGKIKREGLINAIQNYVNKEATLKKELKIIRDYHLINEEERKQQKEFKFECEEKISIITPLYNTPKDFLIQLIDSVEKQTYSNWELCLADGSDLDHEYVREICMKYMEADNRIIYKKLEENEGIVGNTNKAIQMATGTYLGLLDHDDILHESALYECMKEIQNSVDFIYTDEMKFEKKIEDSIDIVCKSGFGKDELRSHNYICHFVVFKKQLLDNMTEFYRREYEGSQDYDMVLRLTEKAEKIVHIPKILYYWRVHAGSVAQNLSVKQYAVDAAIKAISDQLKRSGEKGTVKCNLPYETIYRIEYEVPQTPVVSLCLWTEEKIDYQVYIKELLKKTSYRPLEIITTAETSFDYDEEQIQIITLRKNDYKNRYEWFENARKSMTGQYEVYMNCECIPERKEWIEELLMYASRQDVGVVGVSIKNSEEQVVFGGGILDKEEGIHIMNEGLEWREQGYEANMRHVRNTTLLTSVCMMIAKEKLDGAGGFQTDLGDCADIDICLKCLEKHYWNVWNCFAVMKYTGDKSIKDFWNNDDLLFERWKDRIEREDNYYHPLLKKLGKI